MTDGRSGVTSAGRPLEGKVAIVTGGTSGIGAATARTLIRDGAHLVVVGRNHRRLTAVVEELRQAGAPGPRVLGVAVDVTCEEHAASMATTALNAFGRIDILIAAAGTLRGDAGWPRRAVEVSVDEWDEVIGTNLTGVFLTNRAVLPAMTCQGSGNILNVASTSGLRGLAYDSVYCASKFGVIGLSQALAEEVWAHGIRVQVLLPGPVDTPMWRYRDAVPHPGPALPEQRVAELVRYVIGLPDDVELTNIVVTPLEEAGRPPGLSALTGSLSGGIS